MPLRGSGGVYIESCRGGKYTGRGQLMAWVCGKMADGCMAQGDLRLKLAMTIVMVVASADV